MRVIRIHDLSLPLHANVLRYPGDPAPRVVSIAALERGDPLMVSELTLNCHVGTHIDAPAHFVADGPRLDQLAMEHFHGPALVVNIPGTAAIGSADLAHIPAGPPRHLILRTGNSILLARAVFDPSYRTVTAAAAAALAALRPLSVGFDYYSLDPPSATHFPAHTLLARNGIPVLLPLQLEAVEAGEYLLVAMPVPLAGVEAAPVRPVLLELG